MTIALATAAVLVVVLAMQNRGLREDNIALARRATEPYPGMWVPDIAATALDGRAVRLGAPDARAQVLYFFAPRCPYCRRSAPQIRLLAARLRARHPDVALIGVAEANPVDVGAHAREHGYTFPIVAGADHRTIGLHKANAVPTVIVVRRGGRVGYAHVGALDTQDGVDAILDAVRDSPDGRRAPQPQDAADAASANRRDPT